MCIQNYTLQKMYGIRSVCWNEDWRGTCIQEIAKTKKPQKTAILKKSTKRKSCSRKIVGLYVLS
jgi:hypothetical protein